MYTAARDSGKAPNLAGLMTSAREPFSMYSRMMERCVLVLKEPIYFTMFLWRRFLRRSISPTMACRLSDVIPDRDICLMATMSPVCVSVALNTCSTRDRSPTILHGGWQLFGNRQTMEKCLQLVSCTSVTKGSSLLSPPYSLQAQQCEFVQ